MASSTGPRPPARVAAGSADLATVTTIITLAFADDPVWGPAFARAPSSVARATIWRAYLDALMRFPWTWLSAGDEAASVWVPPGEEEMTAAQWEGFVAVLRANLGDDADRIAALFERFEAAHPRDEPHHYLSLLGTHPNHRGAGHGIGLLADNLERVDEAGTPAYLESTNPANDARYGRLGFEAIGSFEGFVPGTRITTMWRPPNH